MVRCDPLGRCRELSDRDGHRPASARLPSDAETLRAISRGLKRIGRLDDALRVQLKLIALSPKNSDDMDQLGDTYFLLNKVDQAIETYGAAIAIDPRNWNALGNRGYAFEKQGVVDAAIRDYGNALALNPRSVIYMRRGIVHQRKGNLEQATRDLDAATIRWTPICT